MGLSYLQRLFLTTIWINFFKDFFLASSAFPRVSPLVPPSCPYPPPAPPGGVGGVGGVVGILSGHTRPSSFPTCLAHPLLLFSKPFQLFVKEHFRCLQTKRYAPRPQLPRIQNKPPRPRFGRRGRGRVLVSKRSPPSLKGDPRMWSENHCPKPSPLPAWPCPRPLLHSLSARMSHAQAEGGAARQGKCSLVLTEHTGGQDEILGEGARKRHRGADS